MIPNPLARQRRLGAELVRLRQERGLSHARLATLAGVSTSVISRIENPFADLSRRPDLGLIRQLLDALGVAPDSDEYAAIQQHAAVAAAGGWWTRPRYTRMGTGQRDTAIVEVGASRIDEYAGLLLPGLVQTAEFARLRSADIPHPDAVAAGRVERQRQVADAAHRLVIEEPAIRRWPVPAMVMLDQLHHLLKLMERPNLSIRVLPVDANLGDGIAPRAPYAHLTYPDSADPPIVVVDQVKEVRLVTEVTEVAEYARLHTRLRDAALSDADSAALIRSLAESLAARK